MVKAAHDAALEEAPERFEIIRMNLAAHILALTVPDRFMRKVLFQESVTRVLVCGYQVNCLADSLTNKCVKRNGVGVLDNLADHVTFAANSPDHANLAAFLATANMCLVVPMTVLVLAANEGFIHFDDTHQLAKIRIMHRRAEPHAHIPRGLVRAASNLALNLKSANALFGIEHLPENLKPSLKWIFSVLENRSADDTEAVVLAWLAEPVKRPCVEFIDGGIPTFWTADNAILPTPFHEELLA